MKFLWHLHGKRELRGCMKLEASTHFEEQKRKNLASFRTKPIPTTALVDILSAKRSPSGTYRVPGIRSSSKSSTSRSSSCVSRVDDQPNTLRGAGSQTKPSLSHTIKSGLWPRLVTLGSSVGRASDCNWISIVAQSEFRWFDPGPKDFP